MNDQYHEMKLEKLHASGVEEWYCPACGRRFLVQWPPAYKMIILEPGDKDIRHNLSRVNSGANSRPVPHDLIDESRLIPWIKWMESVNFDGRWGKSA